MSRGGRSVGRVSVVIPAKNEARNIEWVLERIPHEVDEVVLVDGRSTDGTVEIAIRYGVTVVQIAPDQQPSCGLGPQLGYQYSKGDYLCLMDGDMLLDAEFLGRAVAFLREWLFMI